MADKKLSEEEVADLKEAFAMFDINGDGKHFGLITFAVWVCAMTKTRGGIAVCCLWTFSIAVWSILEQRQSSIGVSIVLNEIVGVFIFCNRRSSLILFFVWDESFPRRLV